MGVRLVKCGSLASSGGGISDHPDLTGRDERDQHPIYAITGLQEVLNILEDSVYETNQLLVAKDKATNIRIDDVDRDIADIRRDNSSLYDKVYALKAMDDVADTYTLNLDFNQKTKILKGNVKIHTVSKEDSNKIAPNILSIFTDGLYVPKIMTEETKTIRWDEDTLGESLEELFQTGIRFSFYNNNYNYSDSEKNAWYWDNNLKSFVQPLNTYSFNGFVSVDEYDYYEHVVTLRSTNSDNDLNGVVIAYIVDENNLPHTLSVLCTDSGLCNGKRWCLVYNYSLPGQSYLKVAGDNGTVPGNPKNNWSANGNGITVRVVKDENLVTAACSDWNSTVINENTLMTINLEDYSWGHYFVGPVHYGYCNQSQASSFFTNVRFASMMSGNGYMVRAHAKISKDSNNGLIIKDDGLYVDMNNINISKESNNAIETKTDGLYVKKIVPSKISDNAIEFKDDGIYVRKFSNIKLVTQSNHGFVVGDVIFYHPVGEYKKALAIDSYESNIVGVVTLVIDDNTFEYMWNGFFETSLFSGDNGFSQGMPLYISDIDSGKVTQTQPDISKTIGYPVENRGIIISIERGIQYNHEPNFGDFKTSANTYNVRSDGFIRVGEDIDYKISLVNNLLEALDTEFISKYIIIDDAKQTIQFKNVNELYKNENVTIGLNLFIKAF